MSTFRALVLENTPHFSAQVREVGDDFLGDGDVTLAVEYSTLNPSKIRHSQFNRSIAHCAILLPSIPASTFLTTILWSLAMGVCTGTTNANGSPSGFRFRHKT